MKVFISGKSGFIGKNLIESLPERYSIVAPTHKELDLTDSESVRAFFSNQEFDVVIHCAVKPGHRNASDLHGQFIANSRMFFNIVRNSGYFKKMIYLSSGLAYGLEYYQPKMPETYFDQHVPGDEGGFSKYIAAKYCETAGNIVELRPFGVFGKYEDYAIRFISNVICKTLFDMPITIRQNRRFDYIYIDDLVSVIDFFIMHPVSRGSYNVTPDSSIELKTLAEMVLKASGKSLPIFIREEGFGLEYSGDNRRLRETIPDLQLTPLGDAINKLYAWYKERRDSLDQKVLLVDK